MSNSEIFPRIDIIDPVWTLLFLSLFSSIFCYYTFWISVWVVHTSLHKTTHIVMTEFDFLSFYEKTYEML